MPVNTGKDKAQQTFVCWAYGISVVPPGIEPGTQGFSVLCSTD